MPGCAPEAITQATPPPAAIDAATTFERMPPEPSPLARGGVEVELGEQRAVVHLAHELGALARGSRV